MMPRLLPKPVPSAAELQIVAFEFRLRSRLRPTRRCVHAFTAGRTGNFFRRFRAPRYSPLFSFSILFYSAHHQWIAAASEPHRGGCGSGGTLPDSMLAVVSSVFATPAVCSYAPGFFRYFLSSFGPFSWLCGFQ